MQVLSRKIPCNASCPRHLRVQAGLMVPGAQAGRSGLDILGDGARRTGAQSFLDAHDLGVKVVPNGILLARM